MQTRRQQGEFDAPESNARSALLSFSEWIKNSGANCGIGPGGFQPGNTCAKGGGGRSDQLSKQLKAVDILPTATGGSMDVATAKKVQKQLHQLHEQSPEVQATVRLLKEQTVIDSQADIVQAVVGAVAAGKNPVSDKKVSKAVAKHNRDSTRPITEDEINEYATDAVGYLKVLESAPSSSAPLYRGQKKTKSQAGDVIELSGLTSASESQDVAAYYSGGELLRISPGAKYVSVEVLKASAEGEDGGVAKHRTEREPYKKIQPAYHNASLGTDEEVITTGKFRVKSVTEECVSYEDQITGKRKTKKFRVVEVEPV